MSGAAAAAVDRLDAWVPEPDVRTHHRRRAAAAPPAVWEAATALRLSDTRTLGRLVRWRIPRTPADLTFRDLLARYPFTLLEEGEHHSVSGMCGRIWTLARDYPTIAGANEFLAWNEPGTVRIAFATWAEPDGDGAVLVDEARVQAIDRRARLRLRALWATVGRFEPLIGNEAIEQAVRHAERARKGSGTFRARR